MAAPTLTAEQLASLPGWAQQIQQFGNLSNLPPELWSQIQAYAPRATSGAGGPQYGNWNYGDFNINPEVSQGWGQDGVGNDTLQGFAATHNGNQGAGELYGQYGTNGDYQGLHAINHLNSGQLFIEGLLTALSMGTLGPAMAAADTAAAAGGAGVGATELGTNGAWLGADAASGIPAWDAALSSSQVGGLAGAGGTAFNAAQDSQAYNAALKAAGGDPLAGYTSGGTFNINGAGTDMASADAALGGSSGTTTGGSSASNYTNGSDLMSDAFDANGAHGVGGFGGTDGSWLSSLVSSVGGSGSSYGKLLTSLLGGAMGSRGVQSTTSTQRTIDPRMNSYVYGDANNPGILGYTQSLLHSQMQPGALQGYTDMQNVGRGLLNQPVAPNGYNRFFGSR